MVGRISSRNRDVPQKKYFISNKKILKNDIKLIMDKMYFFLKYYNNNYRPIYHLENIFYYIITKIQNKNELL